MDKLKLKRRRERELSNVSAFIGEVRWREGNSKGKPPGVVQCFWCEAAPAMWQHVDLKGRPVYLCFGCGDH